MCDLHSFCILGTRMGFELQYDGLQRGYDLNYPHFDAPARPLAEACILQPRLPSLVTYPGAKPEAKCGLMPKRCFQPWRLRKTNGTISTIGADMYRCCSCAIASFQDWVFGIAYIIELVIRITGTKWAFCCDPSNWFDTSLVLLWMSELTLSTYMYVDSGLVRTLACKLRLSVAASSNR